MSNDEAMLMRPVSAWALTAGLLLAACSGRVDVGSEPVDDPQASGGSGSTGSNPSSSGTGVTGGNAGTAVVGNDTTAGVCSFAPSQIAPDSRPLLTSAQVLQRIYRFLENDAAAAPQGTLPNEPNASWAAARAKAILDGHAAEGTAAAGLVRFLNNWLDMQHGSNAEFETPTRWALKLAEPDATLSTLLAAPAGEHRVGILTEPEFLTTYQTISQRGAWMSGSLLCMQVPPPPPTLEQGSGEGATRRERLESAVGQAVCAGCHQLMDPAGSSLEHFDEAGNYREQDNGQPVDAAATLQEPPVSFADYSELAPQLATSCAVGRCFAQLFGQDAFGVPLQGELVLTEAELNRVAADFANADYSIRTLVDSIVRSPSFLR